MQKIKILRSKQELTWQLEGLAWAQPAPLLIFPPSSGLSARQPPQPRFPARQPDYKGAWKVFWALSFIWKNDILLVGRPVTVNCYGFPVPLHHLLHWSPAGADDPTEGKSYDLSQFQPLYGCNFRISLNWKHPQRIAERALCVSRLFGKE